MSTSIINVVVPSSGFGPAADVSTLAGTKTIVLTGRFRGSYVLYGSHDNIGYVPILGFNAGGLEEIRQVYDGALSSVKLLSLAKDASGVTANVSGLEDASANSFQAIANFTAGSSGIAPVADLGDTYYQTGLNFIVSGPFVGQLVIEGGLDASHLCPIGQCTADPAPLSPPLEFGPIATPDKVRYVRVSLLGTAGAGGVTVSAGGSQSTGGSGSAQTLAQTYDAGTSSADQYITLADAHGGGIIIDGTGVEADFTGPYSLQVWAPEGSSLSNVGLACPREGGIEVGPDAILVGSPGAVPTFSGSNPGSIVIGGGASAIEGWGYGDMIVVGRGATSNGCDPCIVIGAGASVDDAGYDTMAFGHGANGSGYSTTAFGVSSVAKGDYTTSLGPSATSYGNHNVCAGYQSAAGTNSAPVDDSVCAGYQAEALASNTVVFGHSANALGLRGIAIGEEAMSGIGGEGGASNTAIGDGAQANTNLVPGSGCLSVGLNSRGYGDLNSVVGSYSTAFGSSNNLVGSSHVVGTASVAMNFNQLFGNTCTAWGNHLVCVGDVLTAGTDVDNQNVEVALFGCTSSAKSSYATCLGTQNTIKIGSNYSTLVGNDGVVETGAEAATLVGYRNHVYASTHVTALGFTVVVGSTSDGSVGIGNLVTIGDNCTQSVAIGGGANVGALAAGSIVVGSQATASPGASDAVAIGPSTTVTGAGGLAVMSGASAGANQAVFGSTTSPFSLYKTVSNLAGNPDLFKFISALGSNGDTGMFLLCKATTSGAVTLQQVTMSAPVGGYSNLQVSNS